MTEMKILIVLFFIIQYTNCSTDAIIDKVNILIQKHKHVYGIGGREKQAWNPKMESTLEYPRGDKQKLTQIANIWCTYYECTAGMLFKLTPSNRMQSRIQAVYEGAIVKLRCRLCVAPGELSKLVWKYAESVENITFDQIVEHDNMVHENNGDITIYHVEPSHAGVYRCDIGRTVSGLLVLHVLDDQEEYDVVKPSTSLGPYSASSVAIGNELTLFTSWSAWSKCSTCGKVGRRRRYGICYVKINQNGEILKGNNSLPTARANNTIDLDEDTAEIFQDFPNGIPCRAAHLPRRIKELPAVKQRRNEIMIAMCKVLCSNKTRVPAKANTLPPFSARKTQYEVHGKPIKIRCPGTTHRDMPVSWHIGTKAVNPRLLDEDSKGRIHLNARDHLVFTSVQYSDTDLYSCWQGDVLAGTVELVVWCGDHSFCSHQTLLVAMLVAVGLLLQYMDRVLYNRQRQVAGT